MDESTAREALIATLRGERLAETSVLEAMMRVSRQALIPYPVPADVAYADQPLPIGRGQTISQPRVVAMMTSLAQVRPGDRVLEVGTGSGYQAAVLAELGAEVYSIERIPELAEGTRARLEPLGYLDRVHLRVGDGHLGWPEEGPFDAILVTAAPARIPSALVEQLKTPGRLVIPVGEEKQTLRLVERTDEGCFETDVTPVRFVPLVSS